MLTELAKHGVHLRGRKWTTKSLARALQDLGYDIRLGKEAKRKAER